MSLQNNCCRETERLTQREEALYAEVIERLDFSRELEDEEVEALLDEVLCQRGRQMGLTAGQRELLRVKLFNRLRRLDVLQEL